MATLLRPFGPSPLRQLRRTARTGTTRHTAGLRPALAAGLPLAGAAAPTRVRCLSGLTINADRLRESIHHTCQWGAAHRYGSDPTHTGMARLALTDDDARVRRWFADEVRGLGCTLTVDDLGNMFARTPGALKPGSPMTAMGSHLDTQPRGGRYDGILGVMAGLEVLRTLRESGRETKYDVGVINWTNEEGARFPASMVSSAVWAGQKTLPAAHALADIFDPSATIRSELERTGFLGATPCSHVANPLGAHFELHIEQGPILEAAGRKIGVVRGAQAYKWLTVTVAGRDAHTGTTPLAHRSDSVLAAAKMIAASNEVARRRDALASTGVIKMPPGSSTNTLASQVSFTLDIRHPEDAVVAEVLEECLARFEAIAREDGRGVGFSYTLDTDSPATRFHADCIGAVRAAADELVGPEGWLEITSGAGHDSVCTSAVCPTTMIFVPCRDGVSHHPEEYCSPEDCAIGTQALLEAVLTYDETRTA